MRQVTETFNVYTIDSAPEEIREIVLEKYWDINVGSSHWYEDTMAELLDMGINLIDVNWEGRESTRVELTKDPVTVARAIVAEYGEQHAMRYTAKEFLDTVSEATGVVDDREFIRNLAYVVSDMFRSEYDYLTSKEVVVEILRANEYEFTEDGRIYSALNT